MATRDGCKQIAKETQEILENGHYVSSTDGKNVDITESLAMAKELTEYFSALNQLEFSFEACCGQEATEYHVWNCSTLTGLRRLVEEEGEENVAVLNFASARNPGGGFLTGARAQEESLCRASGLYPCLIGNGQSYYNDNRRIKPNEGIYTDGMIYSPHVPVFRLDDGELVAKPVQGAFVTVPAVNAGVYRKRATGSAQQIEEKINIIMQRRMNRFLRLMHAKGHTVLVLGAWGCGAFCNKPEMIAQLFYECLRSDDLRGAFKKVVFAIINRSKSENNLNVFHNTFENVEEC